MKHKRKEERLEIGREVYESNITHTEASIKYQTGRTNIAGWVKLYKESIGIIDIKESKNSIDINTPYNDMSSDELRLELMRRDIEIQRLKKGYTVKGGGANSLKETLKD
jgi:transposase